jgi:hypothetical protein
MSEPLSIAEEEIQHQQAVLRAVLDLQPNVFTRTELIRYLGADMEDPLSIEPWSSAIRDLHRVSLLRSEGESIYPTMAAVSFASLIESWV